MANPHVHMVGARALVACIIAQAARDYFEADSNQFSARDYFSGPLYRHHLAWLELPTDWLPAGVQLQP